MNRIALSLSAVAVAAVLGFGAPSARAADPATEIATAAAHAGMAAASADLTMVHMHLHHVINCLAGPGGAGYDAAQANPCKDQGMGAIPDSMADKRGALESAAEMAKQGLAQDDPAMAKQEAAAVQAALKKTM